MDKSAAAIRIVIADDHPIVLDGLEQLFRLEPGMELLARCRDGEETVEAVRRLRPDVLVLDVRMPGRDGLDVLQTIEAEGMPTRVVLLTAALDDVQFLDAIRLGAQGVVLKEMAPQLLLAAVREVHAGGQWLEKGLGGRALRKLVQRETSMRTLANTLTPREMEIVRMLASGMRNRSIADKLFISEGTVKVHLHNIYEKLQVSGRFELMAYVRDRGLE